MSTSMTTIRRGLFSTRSEVGKMDGLGKKWTVILCGRYSFASIMSFHDSGAYPGLSNAYFHTIRTVHFYDRSISLVPENDPS